MNALKLIWFEKVQDNVYRYANSSYLSIMACYGAMPIVL